MEITIDTETGHLSVTAGGFAYNVKPADIAHNWNNLSHFPERRARVEICDLATRLQAMHKAIQGYAAMPDVAETFSAEDEAERYTRRHVDLTRDYWSGEARCASSFITGGSNFPVRRMQKYQSWQDTKAKAITEHQESAEKAIKRAAFPHGAPGDAIRADDPDALCKLNDKLATLREAQEAMRAANALWRKLGKPSGKDADLGAERDKWREIAEMAGCDADKLRRSCRDHYMAPCRAVPPFESFSLSNNNAEIKRLQQRIALLSARVERGTIERETEAGCTYRENAEAQRVQLVFPGKPDDAVRTILKSNGFRWSPREGAWQRHLNQNGRWAAERAQKEIQELATA